MMQLSNQHYMTGRRGAMLLLILLSALIAAFVPLPSADAPPRERVVRLEAGQYHFEPGVVTVNPGDQVTLELVAVDVVHGVYIDGYGHQLVADPGQTARMTFVADRAGSFRLRCAVPCGAMHPFMIGTLRVGQNGLLWRGLGLALLAAIAGLVLAGKKA